MSRAARFAAAYAALLPAHDLADHVVQTDHQAAHKAASWTAMAGHVGGYHAVQFAAVLTLRTVGVRPSWRRTAAAVLVSAGTHTLLDRRWPVTWILDHTGSRRFARPVVIGTGEIQGDDPMEIGALHVTGRLPVHGPYLADQALHHAVLALCAAILAGGSVMAEMIGATGQDETPRDAAIRYARNRRDHGQIEALALLHIGDQLARIAAAMEAGMGTQTLHEGEPR